MIETESSLRGVDLTREVAKKGGLPSSVDFMLLGQCELLF